MVVLILVFHIDCSYDVTEPEAIVAKECAC